MILHKPLVHKDVQRYRCFTPLPAMTRSPSLAGADRKKTAWDVWANCDSVTTIFSALPATPELRTVQESLPVLKRFMVLVYDRTSEEEAVNVARKHLFTKIGRNIEAIPSTQAALVGHTKRAAYTSGHNPLHHPLSFLLQQTGDGPGRMMPWKSIRRHSQRQRKSVGSCSAADAKKAVGGSASV